MRSHILLILIVLLIGLNTFIYMNVWSAGAHTLRVSVLDVGQGDSILIQGPTGNTVLVDGGPGQGVLAPLSTALPLFDRSIDLVVETHPDKDHIGGLPSVFNRYAVSGFMEPGIPNDTAAAQALAAAVDAEPGAALVVALRGMRIDMGGGAYADVLYPDRDPSLMETNNGSVVLHLVYGKTSFMLTGDLPSPIEDWLAVLDADDDELSSDVLKAGHHGSKNSTDDAWLAALHPSMVAISAGKDNSYGHPSPETITRIENEGVKIFSTIDSGTLTFISDGEVIRQK